MQKPYKPKPSEDQIDFARTLRQNQTDAEQRLWHHLKNRQLAGIKFKRQSPIGPYVADFISKEAKRIIELDGGQHATQIEYDQERECFLKEQGYTVVRFWNHKALQHTQDMLQCIYDKLKPYLPPHPNPLPKGRGNN